MSLQTATIDAAWRQRCIELAEQARGPGQAEFRAKAHAYLERQKALRLREAEIERETAAIERERAAAERKKLAEVLIREWDERLRTYALALQNADRGPAWAAARADLVAFGAKLQEPSEAAEALREHGAAAGWEKQPYLERVVASAEPGQLIDRMLKVVEDGGLDHASEPHVAGGEQVMSERSPAQVMVR